MCGNNGIFFQFFEIKIILNSTRYCPKQVNIRDQNGTSALVAAVKRGNSSCVRLLLQTRRCEFNATTRRGRTVVHEACKAGHTVVAMMLLTFGADPNRCDEWGNSPLMYAVLNGHLETARQLVRGGCNVNSRSRISYTALHTAAENGGQELVKMLLDAGALPDVRDKNGNTPLLLAASSRFPRIVTSLLDVGCDVTGQTTLGRTALHFAALHKYAQIAQRLVAMGAPPDVTDHLGCTPLTLAVGRNFTPIVHMLLRLNCRVDRVVKDTPLFIVALKQGDVGLLRLLAEAGAECSCAQPLLATRALPSDLTENKKSMTWLYDVTTNPRTLRDIAAIRVRRCMGHGIEKAVTLLPLPATLQTRLLLRPLLPPAGTTTNYIDKPPPYSYSCA